MPRPLTELEAQAFLAEPHIAVLSVASGDARPPLATPVWYAYEPGGLLTFFTMIQGGKSRKTALIRKAGVLSFCVQREEFPYKYVTIEGSLFSVDQPPSAEQVLTIVRRYLTEEQAQGYVAAEMGRSDAEMVLFNVRPERWNSLDFSDDGG